MHDLLAIEAHGGLARWNRVSKVSAALKPNGLALKLRGQESFARSPTRVIIDTREQLTTFDPFLMPGQVGVFEPYRTAVWATTGGALDELKNPRDSFKPDTSWTGPQLAYFAGYAIWTYLELSFSLLTDGVGVGQAEPWTEGGETWRAPKVNFPKSYVAQQSRVAIHCD
jgi:hypothetical protein